MTLVPRIRYQKQFPFLHYIGVKLAMDPSYLILLSRDRITAIRLLCWPWIIDRWLIDEHIVLWCNLPSDMTPDYLHTTNIL